MDDTLQMTADSLMLSAQQGDSLNWWMIIAIIELVVIIVLLFSKIKSDSNKQNVKKKVMEEGEIDWDNTIKSSFGAEHLYKELVKKCHPDRFEPDKEKVAIANDITERLGKHKYDLEILDDIKEEAAKKLNINI